MTRTWPEAVRQILFICGIFALAFATIESSSTELTLKVTPVIENAQAPALGLS